MYYHLVLKERKSIQIVHIIRQNEQSLSLKVNDLQPKDSKGVYKMIDYDMRQYKSVKMFIHAESLRGK